MQHNAMQRNCKLKRIIKMAKRQLSTAAQAAAQIRKELKKHGIKATVRSGGGSMTDKVSVSVKSEIMPTTYKALESFCNQYQMGHFNGMEDIYEYSNTRDDLPQVDFVFVEYRPCDELMQDAWDFYRYESNNTDKPSDINEAVAEFNDDFDLHPQNIARRIISGYAYGHTATISQRFWTARKPRQIAAA